MPRTEPQLSRRAERELLSAAKELVAFSVDARQPLWRRLVARCIAELGVMAVKLNREHRAALPSGGEVVSRTAGADAKDMGFAQRVK